MRIRAFFLIILVILFVVTHDLFQRTLLPLSLRIFPNNRERILTAWSRWISAGFVNIARVTRIGDFPVQSVIPSDPGVLVLMNHQSLVDVPLVVLCFNDGYPMIVTRERYAKGIPLISGIVQLLEFPTVSPRKVNKKSALEKFSKAAKGTKPLAVYPEGTRSRTGDLLPFRQGALKLLFDERRQWKVYLLVADGAWPYTTFNHILSLKHGIKWKMKVLGPFDSPERIEDLPSWTEDMEDRMRKGLASLREGS